MAFSTQRATSDGTLEYLALSIDFLDREDIQVFLDDLPTTEGVDWEWDGTNDAIRFLSAGVPTPLADGVEVLIARNTDLAEVLHVFSAQAGGGGSAKFVNLTMDENFKQLLLIAQEAKEGSTLSDIFQNLDMHGYKLRNNGAGDVNEPGDLPNMGQIFTISGMAGTYANQAASSATASANSATLAGTRATAAQAAQTAAETAEANAEAAASTAAADANAQIAPNVAAAVAAKNAAETAEDGAAASATSASGSASTATTQAGLANTARANAQAAETNAESAADLAEQWATLLGTAVDGSEYSAKHYAQEAAASAASIDSQALSTDYAGPTPPAITWPFMTWADTGNMLLKRRNEANTEWVVEGELFVRPVKSTGDTITGPVSIAAGSPANSGALRITQDETSSGIGVILRKDSADFLLLLTDNDDAQGNYNSLRPLAVNLSTGAVSINSGTPMTTANLPSRGAVGSYATCYYTSSSVDALGGTDIAATSLRFSNFDASAFDGNSVGTGTWRLMGRSIPASTPANAARVGLFLRVA